MKYPVIIGVPYAGGFLHAKFVQTLLPLVEQSLGVLWEPGPRVGFLRNQIANRFLKIREAEWLLYVDADQSFPPDTIARLMSLRSGFIRSGLYCSRLDATMPVAKIKDEKGLYQPLRPDVVKAGELIPVDGIGMGCCLVHRSVFETVPFPWSEAYYTKVGDHWKTVGPDIDFCEKVRAAGFEIMLDCGLIIGHIAEHIMVPDYELKVLYEEVT